MTLTAPHHTHDSVWRAALTELELSLTTPTFETWLKPTYAVGFDGDTILIATPSAYGKDWLENKLGPDVRRALSRVVVRPMNFRVVVTGRRKSSLFPPNDPGLVGQDADMADQPTPTENGDERSTQQRGHRKPPADHSTTDGGESSSPVDNNGHGARARGAPLALERSDLNPRYTFSTFIVGNSNRLAYAAANAVAEGSGARFNPLFIYGGVGLGKTHILQAIGHQLASRRYRVRYVTTEAFTNDLIGAIRTQTTEDFRNRYRQVDVLLLDDIQFLIGKEQTQEEVFHTFNAIYSANRQIVISSDRAPRALMTLEARLRSRFEGGLIADIQPPDLEMRLAILRTKNERQPIPVPDNVIELLANRIQTNIRELEGALVQVVGYAQLMQTPVTIQIADNVLSMSSSRRPPPTLEAILHAVAEFYRLTPEDLVGTKRSQRIVVPRHVAMYLMRDDGQASLPQIGQILNRDHTTVLHGVDRISQQLETNETLRRDVLAIRDSLHHKSR